MNNLLNTGVIYHEKFKKMLVITEYLFLAVSLYLNYQMLSAVNLLDQNTLLIVMAIVALFSIFHVRFGASILFGVYALAMIPVNVVYAGVYLVLAVMMVSTDHEKNTRIMLALVYFLHACTNPLMFGFGLSLYYILFEQRKCENAIIVSIVMTMGILHSECFYEQRMFCLPVLESVPEDLWTYLAGLLTEEVVFEQWASLVNFDLITLILVFGVSVVYLWNVRVSSKTRTLDMYQEFRLSFVSALLAALVLCIIACVVQWMKLHTIPVGMILQIFVGCFCGLVVSFFVARNSETYIPPKKTEEERAREKVKQYVSTSTEGDYIFISYCRRDAETVYPIMEKLEKAGFKIWYDKGIEFGSDWRDSVAQHLNDAKVCLAFISKESLKSDNCEDEIYHAVKKKKGFLAVYLEPCELTPGLDLQISRYQSLMKYEYFSEKEFMKELIKAESLQSCKKNQEAPEKVSA